jgi:hypothetical protein
VVHGHIFVESGAFALQVKAAGPFESTLLIYQTTWHRIPEICSFNFYFKCHMLDVPEHSNKTLVI